MSSASDRPFTEPEKLCLLAEILKVSISVNTFRRIITESQIEPEWNEIALPFGAHPSAYFHYTITPAEDTAPMNIIGISLGRSLSACQRAYGDLFPQSSDLLVYSHIADASEQTFSGPKKKKKRSLPTGEASTSSAARTIQPRPLAFAPVNGQEGPTTVESDEPPKKKRGRPSKAEQEIRAARAAERGEIYPPPKKVKTPRSSMEGGAAPVAVMTTPPTTEAPSPAVISTEKRKRGRPAKAQPGASKSSLEATAYAVEQMQAEAGHVPGETVAETHAPEYTSPYHTLAEMQEQAEQGDVRMMEPETAESSHTLQQLSGQSTG